MKPIIKDLLCVEELKPTFCGEISFKMRASVKEIIETIESYYTVDGTFAIVKDKRDGQEYTIEIKPLVKNDPSKR